ncbi:conserved exported hypothetical protein [Cupriavidus taiwanensis]|uniref:DUF1254 domain-containing protein n=1 Tax=Cupriavidus taiwanensis TaxID=164546 RepID=UPI000E160B2F|nr:DUF1254 domain-containing protein [Cupriavidus taiwanensis]SPA03162.1 conserved exported hypothetical protein [Cupriavidus taiwanensis]
MRWQKSARLAVALVAVASGLAHAAGGNAATPDGTLAFAASHYPEGDTAARLYDELDYQRAVQAYIWAQPLVGLAAMAEGARRIGIRPMELFVFDQLEQVNQRLQTGNDDVVYSFSYFNLRDSGPLVVEIPAGNQYGVMLDAWQRPIEDVGRIGPDAGNGGRYLIVPPGYRGELPAHGYLVRRSPTHHGMLFLRAVRRPGEAIEGAVARLAQANLYPYAARAAPPALRMRRMGMDDYDGLTPHGLDFFRLLAQRVGEEPGEERDRMMLGMLATLDIEQGKPFAPDARLSAILERAASTGRMMVANLEFNPRKPRGRMFKDTQWRAATGMSHYTQELGPRTEIDERAALFRFGFGMHKFLAPGYKPLVGKGAIYATTYRDAGGRFLQGSSTYRLRVPADVPVQDYWSVSAYDADTFSFVETDQRRPSLSSLRQLKRNADGSVDLYFGPAAPAGMASNWIQTVPGRGFFLLFRLYGPTEALYAGKWQLGDVAPAQP